MVTLRARLADGGRAALLGAGTGLLSFAALGLAMQPVDRMARRQGAGKGWARQMAQMKSTLGIGASGAGPRPATAGKSALPQKHKPAKPAGRGGAKAFQPRVVADAAPAAAPVILWDDPVEPASPEKPPR